MLNSFPSAMIAGVLTGYLAGIGVGGGSLLILWLTTVLGIRHDTARAINLMFFLVSAGVVSIFRFRQGKLDLPKILPAIIAGAISAGLCSTVSKTMDTELLKKMFGILLIFTGIRELLYRPAKFK